MLRAKGKIERGAIRKPALERVKGRLIRTYDPYPEGHPATEYVRDIFSELGLNGDFKLLVGSRWHEVNGLCLPDNTIMVSLGAVKALTPGELKALLAHEASHSIMDDFSQASLQGGIDRLCYSRTAEKIADLYPIVDLGVNPHAVMMLNSRFGAEMDLEHGSGPTRSFHAYLTSMVVDSDATKEALGTIPPKIRRLRGKRTHLSELEELPPSEVHGYCRKFSIAKLMELREDLRSSWEDLCGNLPPAVKRLESALSEEIKGRIPVHLRPMVLPLLRKAPEITKEDLDKMDPGTIMEAVCWIQAQDGLYVRTLRYQMPIQTDSSLARIDISRAIDLILGDGTFKVEKFTRRLEKYVVLLNTLERAWGELGVEEADFKLFKTAACMSALSHLKGKDQEILELFRRIDFIGVDSRLVQKALASEVGMDRGFFERELSHFPCLKCDEEPWRLGWGGNEVLMGFERDGLERFKAMLSRPKKNRIEILTMFRDLSQRLSVSTPEGMLDLLEMVESYLTHDATMKFESLIHNQDGLETLFRVRSKEGFLDAVRFYSLLQEHLAEIFNWGKMLPVCDSLLCGTYKPTSPEELAFFRRHFLIASLEGDFSRHLEECSREWGKSEFIEYMQSSKVGGAEDWSSTADSDNMFAILAFQRFRFDIISEADQILMISARIPDRSLAHRLQDNVLRKMLERKSAEEVYDYVKGNPDVSESVALALWDEVVERIRDPDKIWEVTRDYRRKLTSRTGVASGVSILLDLVDFMLEHAEYDTKVEAATANLAKGPNSFESAAIERRMGASKERLFGLLLTEESDEKLVNHLKDYIELQKVERDGWLLQDRDREDEYWTSFNVLAKKQYESAFALPASVKSAILERLLLGKGGLATTRSGRDFLKSKVLDTMDLGDDPVSSLTREVLDGVFEHADQNLITHHAISVLADRILVPPQERADWGPEFEGDKLASDYRSRAELESDVSYLLPEAPPPSSADRMSSLEFVLKAGESLGFVPVRLLQLVDTLYELDEDVSSALSGTYDSVRGQSNLTLVHTMRRRMPDFKERVLSIEERLGGGSRAVAAGVMTPDGPRALKVLNPNAEFHARNMLATFRRACSSIKYSKEAEIVFDLVGQWLEEDMYFDKAMDFDRRFNEMNDGFKAPGSQYVIRGLASEGPADKKFMIEEWPVGARNLTSWDELEKEHDMKEVVGTIVHSFVNQVRSGLVHSNIHPGNIAVRGKEIFWYDRNFMLELDPRDIMFATSAGMLSSDPQALSSSFADYLAGFPQNQGERDSICGACSDALSEDKSVSSLLIGARKANASIPLKVLLLSLNIRALEKMARKAGFPGVLEAYLHAQRT